MEYILKMAEKVDQQWTELYPQQKEEGQFKSIFTINGRTILSPLMTPVRRLEMQQHRRAAMAVEEQMGRLPRPVGPDQKHMLQPRDSDCCRLVDASTNTELNSAAIQQPLTLGCNKQQLQLSDTLIYDNKSNAIIKFTKPVKLACQLTEIKTQNKVLKEAEKNSPKQAANESVQSPTETFEKAGPETLSYDNKCTAIIKFIKPVNLAKLLETRTQNEIPKRAELRYVSMKANPTVQSPKSQKADAASLQDQSATNGSSIKKLMNVAQLLNQTINRTKRELAQRATTSPSLPSAAIKKETANVPVKGATDRRERLHPQLWRRHYSYPMAHNLNGTQQMVPISPKAAPNTTLKSPIVVATSNSKIQVKQQHSTMEQQPLTGVASSLTLKRSKPDNRAPSSQAKAQLGRAESSKQISSTQRRLNYDPRATIKRAVALKKLETRCSQPAACRQSGSAELMKRQLLKEMEQKQRQRFQQLVAHQTEKQQRLQAEFQLQQQLLMNQMLCDIGSISFDKDEHSDHANSETSSINSLPQSRLDLPLAEPALGV